MGLIFDDSSKPQYVYHKLNEMRKKHAVVQHKNCIQASGFAYIYLSSLRFAQ